MIIHADYRKAGNKVPFIILFTSELNGIGEEKKTFYYVNIIKIYLIPMHLQRLSILKKVVLKSQPKLKLF